MKSLAGMNWAVENLSPDIFYTSMDDDMMVDFGAMQAVLGVFNATMHRNGWPEFPIVCMYRQWAGASPERRNTSKYYISRVEYPWAKWPKFCLGGMYTTSGRVARELWNVSKQFEPLRMDDVWITGVLREKMGMPIDMVVQPALAVATHWKGYSGQKSSNIRGFMRTEWEKLQGKLVNSTLCLVDSPAT